MKGMLYSTRWCARGRIATYIYSSNEGIGTSHRWNWLLYIANYQTVAIERKVRDRGPLGYRNWLISPAAGFRYYGILAPVTQLDVC